MIVIEKWGGSLVDGNWIEIYRARRARLFARPLPPNYIELFIYHTFYTHLGHLYALVHSSYCGRFRQRVYTWRRGAEYLVKWKGYVRAPTWDGTLGPRVRKHELCSRRSCSIPFWPFEDFLCNAMFMHLESFLKNSKCSRKWCRLFFRFLELLVKIECDVALCNAFADGSTEWWCGIWLFIR